MREIKCKAWDETHKEWVDYGFCLRFDKDGNCEILNAFAQPFSGRKLIPVFWTGLKDKAGVDIYEGDIVQIDDYEGTAFQVQWGQFKDCCVEGETWVVEPQIWQMALWYHCSESSSENVVEVIGTIHD